MRNKKDDRGFSLIEIIISIAILAIVSVSLLGYFFTSIKANARSKRVQQATTLGESVLETCRGCKTNDYKDKFPGATVDLHKGTGVNIGRDTYEIKDMKQGGYHFDAKIKVDASTHYSDTNNNDMFQIKELNSVSSFLANAGKQQYMTALNEFDKQNAAYAAKHPGTRKSRAHISESLTRYFFITFTEIPGQEDQALIDITVGYTAEEEEDALHNPKYPVPGNKHKDKATAYRISQSIYHNVRNIAELRRCYFVFEKFEKADRPEKIVFSDSSDKLSKLPDKLDLYLVCEHSLSDSAEISWDLGSPVSSHIGTVFHNENWFSITPLSLSTADYIETRKQLVISDITVEIYQQGKGFANDAKLITVDTVKGE